ncbi:hypothetical protein CAEBREN_30123 [Caenorhabditis brenneri]|uniref:Uncharacterized protein n=1 Tax=Caenorhabditis brenneri TaxID=135651 RepID=G0P6T7_CAEBE|nr:hypothetical protein CAEBREN_30123 [Caenorhabditis brenneri]
MQRYDDRMPLNSISYSMIQSEQSPQYSVSVTPLITCFCRKRYVNNRTFFQTFSKIESNVNYGTATEHEIDAPYEKHVADRYEAEYDYCMRWACDHKYRAAKVIPFQSNFYSVVRLLFHGKNWGLDCANFDGEFDFSGWLPSMIAPKEVEKSLLTDSSQFSQDRKDAGRTLHSSDTGYGLQSLKTDYSEDSRLTKDPIDSSIYRVMGSNTSESEVLSIENSLHSTLEDISPILENNMALPSSSVISTGSSLKAVFQDLVELDQLFTQQVEEAQRSSLDDYVNCLTTAHSFSDTSLVSQYGFQSLQALNHFYFSDITSYPTASEAVVPSSESKPPTMFSQLICLAGKKFTVAFWNNWSKNKN